jgi:carbamoyl-phosphate synthase large subunit
MPKRNDIHTVLIIGSGPIVIGQACEFDYSGTQACKALRKLGYKIILINSNPATIMTDPGIADVTYVEPLNIKTLEKIIAQERPDALLPNLGGQTALNLSLQLARQGILKQYGVQILGLKAEAIEQAEDRKAFKQIMTSLGIDTPKGEIAVSLEEAEQLLKKIDLPCVIRPAYTMGGAGGGLVYNLEEFRAVANRGLSACLIGQILIEESIEGWEELELEVVRDSNGQKITVCFIENIDAMGVHTGDSFAAAPMLTIAPELQKQLQEYSYAIADAIGIIGNASLKFAFDPKTGRIVIISINPCASRSSALASKATGLPVAYIASLLAGGLTLDEIPYWREGTLEKYAPGGDYVVTKFPRWAFEKFPGAEDRLGTQMRAVGEVMSIGKNFKEAFQKAICSLESGRTGLGFVKNYNVQSLAELMESLWHPTSERHFILYEALRKGAGIQDLYERTHIKPYFIKQMKELVDLEEKIIACKDSELPDELLTQAKKDGFSDAYLARLLAVPEETIRNRRIKLGVIKAYNAVPVSGVPDSAYYYSTYNAPDKVVVSSRKKILVLGEGPNRIGQGIEFDYCCTHAVSALGDLGYETIMVNCNPETVSTDYDISDKLYFEPLTLEEVLGICSKEKPEGVIVQFGGQTASNLCKSLESAGVKLLGTATEVIDLVEDRERCRLMMQELGIPQPAMGKACNLAQALELADRIGYPLILRPAHATWGLSVEIVHDQEDLTAYISKSMELLIDQPILIDKFLENAIKAEADAISDGKEAFVPAIMEHIELAGIHSGDSACVLPAVSIAPKHLKLIEDYTRRIAIELKISGLINVQYAITDDTVYVLKANARASRTVPLVSKVCNLQLVRLATRLIMGGKMSDLNLVHNKMTHYGVKEAVFPFNMLHEIDPVLGPEMRSTGEVLGMADSFELAFHKAQEAAQQLLPQEGTVLFSVSDTEKNEALAAAREFSLLGFKLKATEGTQKFFAEYGIDCEIVSKINAGRPNIVDAIKNGEIQLVINTPIGKRSTDDDSYIRKTAIKYQIPYMTTMAAARAAAKGISARKLKEESAVSLQEYYKRIK